MVGDALYSGSAPYDPRIVSTVRVEARRLRRKLADYYDREGRTDPVRIDLPTGSYRPVFATGVSGPMPDLRRKVEAQCLSADLAIMPFRALSSDAGDDSFADGLTDELIFALEHRSQLKLAPRLMVFQYKNRAYALSEAAESLGVGAVLHGTFRSSRSAYARYRGVVESPRFRHLVGPGRRGDRRADPPAGKARGRNRRADAGMDHGVVGHAVDLAFGA